MNIILVSINNFQEYILTNISQLIRLNHSNIYVIINKRFEIFFSSFDDKIKLIFVEDLNDEYKYISNSRLDKNFRDGFWMLCSARFYYIYEAMKKYDLKDVIHLENDVLLYYNCDILNGCFDKSRVYLPFDTFNRNIASIMYIPEHNILKSILDNYDLSKDDMNNFSSIQKKTGLIENLPIFIPSLFDNSEYNFVTKNYDKFQFIFDAAAIGQYLGGIDPKNEPGNTVGFVNETCVIKYNNFKFEWCDKDNIKKPFIKIKDILYPIFNLHIHSKKLDNFTFMDFEKNEKLFDIVIPIGPNDIDIVHKQVEKNKKNIIGYRNIYLVSYDKNIHIDGCITIDENIFPFTKKDVELYSHISEERSGWVLQQLLKLYVGFVIEGILDRVLIVDSDTIFLHPIQFIQDEKCIYTYGVEYHKPYFEHMRRLHPDLKKMILSQSGITHHMMFEKKYLIEIFNMVMTLHKEEFWKTFLKCISNNSISCASEYEIYYNYMLKFHPEKILIRKLKRLVTNTLSIIDSIDADCVNIHHHYYKNEYIQYQRIICGDPDTFQ